ncbi:hypothetical protein Mame01_53350 [Microbispora amethystogenes]|nr:hypothetical protein Mame01_53350 [Microbispora amethystogenes]
MTDVHLRRLALVKGSRYGSGYAIGPDQVLTSGHVVGEIGDTCQITPFGDRQRDGVVIWRGDHIDIDAALVRVHDKPWADNWTPTRYGILKGTYEVDCLTLGYPWAMQSGGRRLHEDRMWRVMPSTGVENSQYALDSKLTAPRDRPPTAEGKYLSPWAGLSGAAMLSNDAQILLGVVAGDPHRFTAGRIGAVRISALLEDAVFSRLAGADVSALEEWPEHTDTLISAGIVSHADEIASLNGLRRNLRDECLPFVSPPTEADCHPDRLFSTLQGLDAADGILLVGAAGAGKTRTCFEVSDRAVAAGWDVLHVRSGEPLVTSDELANAIAATGDRVLVIIDYLNECRGLDLNTLRNRVLPDARRAGRRVVLLASARPGWQLRTDAPLTPLFRVVRLEPSAEHSAHICSQIADSIAPKAIALLGKPRLLELCGLRPVIAMLIAREAETMAEQGHLDTALRGIRPEELIDWVGRRLEEDYRFDTGPRDPLTDSEPAIALQAITAIVGATPQDEESLISSGAAVLDDNREKAQHLLGVLLTMGWVTKTPDGLASVHDIVTDQFLERILIRQVSWTVRSRPADRVLSACFLRGRNFGRYAMNLGRLIRDLALDGREKSLTHHCAHWLAANGIRAGTVLAEREDEGAYALGAIIENPAWSSVAFAHWPSIVTPWLTTHGHTLSARHLLYKGLRVVDNDQSSYLISEAISWLDRHGTTLEAQFVLKALLDRQELLGSAVAATVAHSMTWLDRHGTTLEAQFVLDALLDRQELLGSAVAATVAHSMTWLDRHGTTLDAGYVLKALLDRQELLGSAVAATVAHSMTWLEGHGTTLEAGYVLKALLDRQELLGSAVAATVAHSMTWLDRHGTTLEARFVLKALLDRQELLGSAVAATVAHSMTWLDRHGTTLEAQFVLDALLDRQELLGSAVAATVAHSMTWLDRHGTTLEARFVLDALLDRQELLGSAVAATVAHSMTWLDRHGTTLEAGYVLKALLDRQELVGSAVAATVARSMTWLDRHGTTLDAGYVLKALLDRQELLGSAVAATVAHSMTWLDRHGTTLEAGFVIPAVLARQKIAALPTSFPIMVEQWFDLHPADPGSGFIAKRLARQGALTERIAQAVISSARTKPDQGDIAWRLTPIARNLRDYPALADNLFDAIESHVRILPFDDISVNRDGEYDGLFEFLVRNTAYRSGIVASRLDDLIADWTRRPYAFNERCSSGSYYNGLVSRVASLTRTGHYGHEEGLSLMDRLHRWVSGWQLREAETFRDEAVAIITQTRQLLSVGAEKPKMPLRSAIM